MKPAGYLISAFYYSEQRPMQFYHPVHEAEMLDKLAELTDALELARENPEYIDILKDIDPELSFVVTLGKLEYRVEEICYE